jgi:hypothetical protein
MSSQELGVGGFLGKAHSEKDRERKDQSTIWSYIVAFVRMENERLKKSSNRMENERLKKSSKFSYFCSVFVWVVSADLPIETIATKCF